MDCQLQLVVSGEFGRVSHASSRTQVRENNQEKSYQVKQSKIKMLIVVWEENRESSSECREVESKDALRPKYTNERLSVLSPPVHK